MARSQRSVVGSKTWFLAVLVGASCAAAPGRAADPARDAGGAAVTAAAAAPLTFSADVSIVHVHVTVTRDDEPLDAPLDAAAFRVTEDGRPQEIAYFAHENVPVSYTLLVDVSSSMNPRLRLVLEALETFVRTMRPVDRASLVLFDTTTQVLQEETGDKEALLAATDRIPDHFEAGTALYEALYARLWTAIESGAGRDAALPARRALVVFSDGKDEVSRRSFRGAVLDAARRADVAVYPVALSFHDGFLERIARETGGRVAYVSHGGELAAAYRAIAAEVASQYTIGYVPGGVPAAGAWRPVRVRVAREGVTVRHRAGYFAPRTGIALQPAGGRPPGALPRALD